MKKILDTIARLVAASQQATDGAAKLVSDFGAYRAALDEKRLELRRARESFLPTPEIAARALAWVDGLAAQERAKRARAVLDKFGRYERSSAVPGAVEMFDPGRPLTVADLAMFAPELLKDSLVEILKTRQDKAGPPAAERSALIERLTGEAAQLDKAEEEAVDAINEAGANTSPRLVVEHRKEVLDRRAAERTQREQTEAATARRKEKEAAIDAQNQRAVARVGRSSYLDSGRGTT